MLVTVGVVDLTASTILLRARHPFAEAWEARLGLWRAAGRVILLEQLVQLVVPRLEGLGHLAAHPARDALDLSFHVVRVLRGT